MLIGTSDILGTLIDIWPRLHDVRRLPWAQGYQGMLPKSWKIVFQDNISYIPMPRWFNSSQNSGQCLMPRMPPIRACLTQSWISQPLKPMILKPFNFNDEAAVNWLPKRNFWEVSSFLFLLALQVWDIWAHGALHTCLEAGAISAIVICKWNIKVQQEIVKACVDCPRA